MTKIDIFDAKISPLIEQLHSACKLYGFPMVANIEIINEGDKPQTNAFSHLAGPDDTVSAFHELIIKGALLSMDADSRYNFLDEVLPAMAIDAA